MTDHPSDIDSGPALPTTKRLRLAVAQSPLTEDPRDPGALHAAGVAVRRQMREAAEAGARLILFPEGVTCAPHKRLLSAGAPAWTPDGVLDDETLAGIPVTEADWSRMPWDDLRAELTAIAALARALRLWTVVGAVHPLTPPNRPHNSLYIVSDQGEVASRYDERLLSNTKATFMYTPGSGPVTFEVDGVRFGCLLGMEAHYAELFAEYERADVDCVLFATTGSAPYDTQFASEVRGMAAAHSFWVAFAAPAPHAVAAPAGLAGPDGRWLARGPREARPALVVADVDEGAAEFEVAVRFARPWRRAARAGLGERREVADPRSSARGSF